MFINRKGVLLIIFLTVTMVLKAQEFFTGSVSPTATISRTGSTTFGFAHLRSAGSIQVMEHIGAAGDFYIRSVGFQIPNDQGNIIINDIGGFVGIGTAKPKEKLSVNGNIRAHEIKVEIANWPDYVFEDNYTLRPLKEVKQFIDQYGHLPEIPRAAEIADEGLSVGQVNTLLMKKVEELTLYIIELEARMDKFEGGKTDTSLSPSNESLLGHQ